MANPTRSSLPDAELNPLLNPLLAKNMGRWAEVYFNAVPERREEAVQELLRELEAEESGGESSTTAHGSSREGFAADSSDGGNAFPEASHPDAAAQSAPSRDSGSVLACGSCGHENRTDQHFCGMCGLQLSSVAASAESSPHQDDAFATPERGSSGRAYGDVYGDVDQLRAAYVSSASGRYDEDGKLERMFGLTPSHGPSFRIVIAGAVAIIAVVLVYVAWHSGHAEWALRRAEDAGVTEQPSSQSHNSGAPANSGDAASGASAPNDSGNDTQPANNAPQNAGTAQTGAANAAQPASIPDNGGQELATAHAYLNGTNGQRVDRAEAAQWLWKAVAKRNLEATVELSDLYLRGDGVAKNCDQGRVLLDAAATRGSKEAGIRLQHLQAFGCQ